MSSSQYVHRKTVPIKRGDAEPLTRKDVQFAVLHHIFSDTARVFTDPSPGKAANKVTFADLYVNALFNSSKCSKVLKDKMVETPPFALEFAKICLLTNVGRINTTMAFFPEMKTALRSYHPVPSLQKTDGNAQDAPRIKNCLKAALLPSEFKNGPPSTPAEVITKVQSGQKPPTSVVNLIFVLANHASVRSLPHFDPPTDFLDLFMPVELSSASRARAFLWLIFHYLEGTDVPNPFCDEYARQHPGKVPRLRHITPREMEEENMDPPDEIEWGRKMSQLRSQFLQKLVNQTEHERRSIPSPAPPPLQRDLAPRRHRTQHPPVHQGSRGETFHHYVPKEREQLKPRNPQPRAPAPTAPAQGSGGLGDAERSMLQQAWFSVNTADPLMDSDEEYVDENMRLELQRRLSVITRLRGKSATPSPPPEEGGYRAGAEGEEGQDFEPPRTFTGQWQQAQWD
ncbi:hypothetical protein GLOTRDRAFT_113402 [Gloeophyllum trabeum ATCC 11539]|uniref:Ino eighty subunit 1 n=1 Tax=Gloeophyllum trabeum (strain ATCC 11539 / FP-39264 / Madison 617) TaxID=670483 RepID=S7S4N4_GLOTA|nr:uncharacterized protein GLOTRDRAFT_113402 [Gloeophyllum trabeum ATCC 11539]EPQ60889.1 hypothetical protein GLOTRDRAFT_113402 [Gloeophyllum trabeum ATCC 11539]